MKTILVIALAVSQFVRLAPVCGVESPCHLPKYAVICEDVTSKGNPQYEYGLLLNEYKAGDVVRLYEQGGDGRTWVMINTAEWIPLEVLCK